MNFTLCQPDGCFAQTVSADATAQLLTTTGKRQADSLVANTAATLTHAGVDSDGDVLYAALMGGLYGNVVTVQHDEGPTGAGNENLILRAGVTAKAILVEFATDGSGVSVTPTGEDVRDIVNGHADASALVTASCPGSGLTNQATKAATPLAGGLDDGDYLKFLGKPNIAMRICRIEA